MGDVLGAGRCRGASVSPTKGCVNTGISACPPVVSIFQGIHGGSGLGTDMKPTVSNYRGDQDQLGGLKSGWDQTRVGSGWGMLKR